MKRFISWSVFLIFAAAQLAMLAPLIMTSGNETLKIALVGPMTGEDAETGAAMVSSAQILVDQVNRTAGLGNRALEISVHDDKNDPETARQIAAELTENKDILAVIGHSNDETARAAAQIYADRQLPAVTGSSGDKTVAAEHDGFFRVGLTSAQQGTFLAHYIARVMKQTGVYIIHGEDAFSRTIATAVEDELWFLKRLGTARVETLKKWSFDPASPNLGADLDRIVRELSPSYLGQPVLLAVPADTAPAIVQRLQDNKRTRLSKQIPYQIIGPDSLATPGFVDSFKDLRKEQFRPGYYTDGVRTVAPFLEDVANQKAHDFRMALKAATGAEADITAAGAYDAASVIVHALQQLTTDPSNVIEARREILERLKRLDKSDRALTGVSGGIYFDRDGNAVKTVPVGVYSNRRLISPAIQLSAIRSIDNLAGADVYQITGHYYTPTDIVYTGVHVNEIKDIDLKARRATVDFNIWFRYRNDPNFDAITFPNAVEDIHLGTPVEEMNQGAETYRLYRVEGTFGTNFLERASGENHVLGMQFRHQELNRERLIFVPDLVGMQQNENQDLTTDISGRLRLPPETDFAVDQASLFLDTEAVSMMGNPDLVGKDIEGYSRLNLTVDLRPNVIKLSRLIESDLALRIFIIAGFLAGAIGIAADKYRHSYVLKWLWFPMVPVVTAMLVTGEGASLALIGDETEPSALADLAGTTMRVLWWMVPAWLVTSFVELFIWSPLEQKTGRQIPRVVRFFFAGTVYTLASLGVTAFVFDQKVTSLLATSGVLAMIIGLAIQMNLSNIFSGIAINIERPFRIGDWIRVGDYPPGKVVGITWRTTRMQTVDRNIICIPNAVASDSSLENLSYPTETYRAELHVHCDPGAKPEWVEKILVDAVTSAAGVLRRPSPEIHFQGVKEWSAVYAVRFFCEDYEASIAIEAAVWRDIIRNLRYAGFESVIHEEFTLFHLSEVAKQSGDMAPVLIDDVEVFEPFKQEQKVRLNQTMARHRLEPDRTVIEQGEAGDSLFIVAEGALAVEITMDDGKVIEVARLGPGDFFGEMALLTGEERGATVKTLTASQVFEIAKKDIEPIIRAYPNITEDLSEILTRRTLENLRRKNEHYASLDEEKSLAKNILSKIGRFFDVSTGGGVRRTA